MIRNKLENREYLISVIVPIYNIERYLRRCLDSIINQSYSNLEIILVDDGSTDNSGKICDEYKLKDDRVLVVHKYNGGLSDARNAGIDKSKGDYIGFVDGDDVIHKDMYLVLLEQLILNDADMSICRFDRFTDSDCKPTMFISNEKYKLNKIISKCVNQEYALKECLSTKRYSVSAWSKLYKRDIFKDIRFPKGYEMEDWAIIIDSILKCKNIALIDNVLYYYYQRENGIMHGDFKLSDLQLEQIFKRNLSLVDAYYPKLHNQAKTNLTAHYFYVIDKIIKSNYLFKYNKEFTDTVNIIKKERLFILLFSKHKITRKMLFLLLLVNVKIYVRVLKCLM